MRVVRSFHQPGSARVSFSVRVLLVTSHREGEIARRLNSLGAQVEIVDEMFTALSDVIDDPVGYSLFVLDCDSANVGGLEGGKRAVQIMGVLVGRVPVILVSQDCTEQRFPEDRMAPTQLRAPVSILSMRAGFEHALRERMAFISA